MNIISYLIREKILVVRKYISDLNECQAQQAAHFGKSFYFIKR